ncbi:hypothetical protein [Gimesia sp.]|uniref:hypothetical protein n=1 Tax=Gimesia sp. TaxID=2024833 RepID=UPI003A956E21
MPHEIRKKCYGDMFPDSLDMHKNTSNAGKVFKVETKQRLTGVLPVAPENRIEIDHAAWNACQSCAEFKSCYQLSMAKIALETAISVK